MLRLMPDTRTRPGVDRRPLLSHLRVQRQREREMLSLLGKASRNIDTELRHLRGRLNIGSTVRTDQLRMAQASINRQMASYFRALEDTVAAGRADAAAAAVESGFPTEALRSVLPPDSVDYLMRSAQESAKRGLVTAEARISGLSQIPLSDRVYHTQALTEGKIDDIVNNALARGASWTELAKDVQGFVRPDTPGGAKYASQRLARTEINNAFHATQVNEGVKQPWVTGLKWEISGSHPKPDECDDYAEGAFTPGGEPGVWRPEDVPQKPHPNCLCFTTPVTGSRQQFMAQFEAGKYDAYLEEEFGLPPLDLAVAKASTKVVSSTPTTPGWAKTRTPKWAVNDLSEQARRNLDEDDVATLQDYVQNGAFAPVNASLRGVDVAKAHKGFEEFLGAGDIDMGWVRQQAADLDRAIAKTQSPTNLTLYRGVGNDVVDKLKRGSRIKDEGFMSTSLNPEVAGEFGETIMKIDYPWARPALHIDAVEDLNLGQNEVLLPRGTSMVVKSIRKQDGKTVVTVGVE